MPAAMSRMLQTLEELFKDHNLVLMVGGSGLYIDARLQWN